MLIVFAGYCESGANFENFLIFMSFLRMYCALCRAAVVLGACADSEWEKSMTTGKSE
jgi:hypothetical protein